MNRMAMMMVAVVGLSGCGGEGGRQASDADAPGTTSVGVLLGPSGRGDRSYNDMVLRGLGDLEGVRVIDLQPSSDADYVPAIQRLLDQGVDLIVAVGFTYIEAVKVAAEEAPNARFILLDGEVPDEPNVRSVMFRPDEGSALVGAVAGLTTSTGKVAFIGGMDIPIINTFLCGFRAGLGAVADRTGKAVTVDVRYVGTSPDAFSNPAKGRDIAEILIRGGADVVYAVAGGSGTGAIQAADALGVSAIGVDTDQSYLAPETVVTSMRKRLDLAVAEAVKDVREGRFVGGERVMTLSNGGVDYVRSALIPDSVMAVVDSLSEVIRAGSIDASCPNGAP